MFITHPYTVFSTVAAAQAIADANTAGDEDGWTYVVIADPKGSGRAIIKVFDETGTFVENL